MVDFYNLATTFHHTFLFSPTQDQDFLFLSITLFNFFRRAFIFLAGPPPHKKIMTPLQKIKALFDQGPLSKITSTLSSKSRSKNLLKDQYLLTNPQPLPTPHSFLLNTLNPLVTNIYV